MNSVAPGSDADPHSIIRSCLAGGIPVNADLDAAIEAHRMAFEQFLTSQHESDRPLAAYAIRAVTLAKLATREDAQRQFDYLAALPISAWEGAMNRDAAEVREETLTMCARYVAMKLD